MLSRGLLSAAMAVALCSPAAAAGFGAAPITMRHLNLDAGQWSGPVIQEATLTGPGLFLRNAGEAFQVSPSSCETYREDPDLVGCRDAGSSPFSCCSHDHRKGISLLPLITLCTKLNDAAQGPTPLFFVY